MVARGPYRVNSAFFLRTGGRGETTPKGRKEQTEVDREATGWNEETRGGGIRHLGRTRSRTEKGKKESGVWTVQVRGKEPKELERTNVSNFSVRDGEGNTGRERIRVRHNL